MMTVRAALAIVMVIATGARAESPQSLQLDAPSVVVVDSAGATVLDKHGDDVRPIASLTKIFVALVLRERKLDLEGWSRIEGEDIAVAEGGARSALRRGETYRNLDLMHAMLLVSDNRVPTALARSVGLSPTELLDAIQATAARLGLEHTSFEDVTGILGNRSTAREMAIAMREVLADPVLARIMRTRRATIVSKRERTIEYKSTVPPLWHGFKIHGGKTGTTEAAGHCMMIGTQLGGRDVTIVMLGGKTAGTRLRDFTKLVRALD
jgi:D-alanyl-D-alanine endopeptidase (penicillin-binding protein 7)